MFGEIMYMFWGILGVWISVLGIKYMLESQNISFPAIGVYMSFYGFMLFCSWLFYDPTESLEEKLYENLAIPEAQQIPEPELKNIG
jgi:hypothetical protein